MAAGCLYTRIRDVWKTINRGDIEQHLIKEGLPFTKEAVDAAHAKYVAELQAADEKAKAAEEARKAAESASESDKTACTTSNSDAEHSKYSKHHVRTESNSNNYAYRPKFRYRSGPAAEYRCWMWS